MRLRPSWQFRVENALKVADSYVWIFQNQPDWWSGKDLPQAYIEANPDIMKARRRVDLEPEWRVHRPVAVNVDGTGRIIILESYRHRLQIYNKLKDYEDHSLNL